MSEPNNFNKPNTEKLAKLEPKKLKADEVAFVLRAIKDIRSEEALIIYRQWYDQEYQRMVKNEISLGQFNWDVAQLQISAGYYKEAVDTLNDIADVAWKGRDDALVDMCNEEIDRINRISKNP